MLRPLHSDSLDLTLQAADLVANQAAVSLELRFARPPRADPALEPLEVGPLTSQARKDILVLRQLDLEAPFARAGVLREDIEDKRRAVEHFDVELALEVPLLRRRQLVVEYHS